MSTSPTRTRPAGWSPGTGILVGAWCVGMVLARLTGAPAVILVLGATAVAAVADVLGGWWALRRTPPLAFDLPPLTTVGQPTPATVVDPRADEPSRPASVLPDSVPDSICVSDCDRNGRNRSRRSRRAGGRPWGPARIVIRDRRDPATTVGECVVDAWGGRPERITATFARPGRVTALRVDLERCGPLGLVAWRRTATVEGLDLLVAPVADGAPVDVDRTPSSTIGTWAARDGRHSGDADGIRPWRRGDGLAAVHWPTSLRADELVVHDRAPVSDERWHVDLTATDLDPARVRMTLEDGLRLGHRVSAAVRGPSVTVVVPVPDQDRAAALSATYAADVDQPADADRPRERWTVRLERSLRQPRRLAVHEPTSMSPAARWSAAGAAVAATGLLAGALDTPPVVLPLVAVAATLGAVASIRLARLQLGRPLWMRAAIVVTLLGALGVIVAEATTVDSLLAALRGPMPNLLMLLIVLHGFEVLDRRTLRAHLAITLVVATYAAGLRIDAALGPWLATWGTAFGVAMALTGRGPRSPVRRPAGQPAGRSAVKARRRPSTTGVLRGVAAIGVAGAVTVALLAVVPVPDGPARLGLPALAVDPSTATDPGSLVGADGEPVDVDDAAAQRAPGGSVTGYPGFTETLDTSIRGDLGDETVMRVRSPEPAFWRGQTFAEFDGRSWYVDDHAGMPQQGPWIDVIPAIGDAPASPVASRELIQTYYIEQDLPNVVFAATRATRLIFDGTVWARPDGALRSDVTLTAGSVYTVLSQRLQVDADVLRAQGDLGALFGQYRAATGDRSIDPFLQLPASTTRRTIELATELRRDGEPTYDTIQRYQAWIAANVEYDLDAPVPAEGADAVDDFLFESRRGFCEQIASALTIMLRSQSVPARLATGYVAGERDRVSGVWNVRASDAHAWVEVWFPQTGWQAFDPTASVPLAADAGRGTVGGDVATAALSWLAAHRIEVIATVAAVGTGWAVAVWIGRLRFRRHRGRWGLLQDRFSALVDGVATNPQRATRLADGHGAEAAPDVAALAADVAAVLDRVAFDPTWADDDAEYTRARTAIATLEHR